MTKYALKKIFRALPVKLIDGLTVPVISAIELQAHKRTKMQ